MKDELAPENFPFIKAICFADCKCTEEALRRRVLRCRSRIAHPAMAAGGLAPAIDAVIENHPWRGYRLNPDLSGSWRLRSCARPNRRCVSLPSPSCPKNARGGPRRRNG